MFFDRFGFLHDKRSIDGKGSSGNPCIYSAYWKALTGKHIDYLGVYQSGMIKKSIMGNDITITRHPDNNNVTSLDEIIGAISLDLIDDEFLKLYDYRWHDTLHSPSKFRIFQALVYCAGKHRNFFKEGYGVRDMHPIAYLVPPHIRHYLNNKSVKKHKFTLKGYVNKHKYAPFFYLWLMSVLIKRNFKNIPLEGEKWYKPWYKFKNHPHRERQTTTISQKNIAWLILSDLGSLYWIKLFKRDKNFNVYFEDENHPIRLFIK